MLRIAKEGMIRQGQGIGRSEGGSESVVNQAALWEEEFGNQAYEKECVSISCVGNEYPQ
jgi:hypothetical protein